MAIANEVSVSRAQFKLDFNPVHIGQRFVGIDRRKFKLSFRPLFIAISYTLPITVAKYNILMFITPGTEDTVNRRSSIIEASYTILTSRTNPLEPQPLLRLSNQARSADGIIHRS